jgi:hypothetical protein
MTETSTEILELSSSCLENPTQLDVLALEAHMLFPNDPVARKNARTTTGLEFATRERDNLPDDFLRALFPLAVDAMPLKLLQQSALTPFKRGFIAGIMLTQAIASAAEGRKSRHNSLSATIKELSNRFEGHSPQTINGVVWPEFKKVSHYWAAYIAAAFPESSRNRPFPCTIEKLPRFLAIAEEFRRLGETTHSWKSPEPTILRPGECVRLPPDFRLPKVTLVPQPRILHPYPDKRFAVMHPR